MENDPTSTQDDDYKSALFVTLLKQGQDNAQRRAVPTDSVVLKDLVRRRPGGSGQDGGRAQQLHAHGMARAEYIPSSLTPGLRWSHDKWLPIKQK